MDRRKTNLVIGRGRLYFSPFAPGTRSKTSERYLGNTPGFTLSRIVEQVFRSRSVGGLKRKLSPVIVSETMTGSLTTDNIDAENIAYWFGKKAEQEYLQLASFYRTFTLALNQDYSITDQADELGLSTEIVALYVSRYGTPINVSENFITSELRYGRFRLKDFPKDVFFGDTITVVATTKESKATSFEARVQTLEGELRFSTSNVGKSNFEYIFPYAILTCSGSLDLKSDNFQQLTFDIEMLQRDHGTPIQRIRIIEEFEEIEKLVPSFAGNNYAFVTAEDVLDTITNFTLKNTLKVDRAYLLANV